MMLDKMNPGFRETSILVMDNAAYNNCPETKQWMAKLGLPVAFLGPYMYSGCTAEYLFAYMKQTNLNPD